MLGTNDYVAKPSDTVQSEGLQDRHYPGGARAVSLSLATGQFIEVPFFLGKNSVQIVALEYTHRETALDRSEQREPATVVAIHCHIEVVRIAGVADRLACFGGKGTCIRIDAPEHGAILQRHNS